MYEAYYVEKQITDIDSLVPSSLEDMTNNQYQSIQPSTDRFTLLALCVAVCDSHLSGH